MVEPPVVGFTGVIWEARPTEQLARDLTTGRGVAPMAEAGAAWAQLAASFGAAVVEYDQIIAKIRESWRSAESGPVIDRIATLRDWLVDAAAAAGHNASRASGQAVAYEVARLAMPHVAEIAALEVAKRGIEQAGAALGAPLVAAAAQVDTEQNLAKANAARVMQSYESATTPLAMPWHQQHPPVIASSAALDAERAAATSTSAPAMPGGVTPATVGGGFGVRAVPRAKTAYHAQTVSQAVSMPDVVPVQSTSVPADSGTGRMMPGGMAPAAAMGGAERTVRAGAAAPLGGEAMEIDAGIDVAPPVLGAAEQAQRSEAS
ncbi:PPE family protein [Nocardia sp. NBC_01730]|uniref:PPE domain-containing protein n=1 Tax=Nocardia sp. NBC_01730 TaxID=2975998 RepID=UPI002E1250C5|nr:PPE family protein [Nocardia sp. NBC_01730]